ncbi:MAG: beta-ketoacyl-ACP synthase II [Clostridiaceae bacterium]|nr:beta-ketoacyl-ACP synthase II [Bacillota bacterium]NLN51969.1 beta-ketoacyl-ACP synthase II [Clostridiaceae bacterium]
MENRVVITGIGLVTPLGLDRETTWQKIKEGKVGITELTKFTKLEINVHVAGQIHDFNPKDYLDHRTARRMDPFTQYAIVAAREAFEQSGLADAEFNRDRANVIVSTGIGGIGSLESNNITGETKGYNRISPFFIPMAIANMAAASISMEYGLHGHSSSIITACAGGTDAIGEAYRQIKHGYMDVAITGGTEATITPLCIGGFAAMRALSTSEDPLSASRPFDKNRDGFVAGEGAGILVLESLEHAVARKAPIIAEVIGYATTSDAYHMTAPDPEGTQATRAMTECLEFAGIKPSEVDYINAHGTSTPLNDSIETQVIKNALGDHAYQVKISSTKSMLGHALGGSGGIELSIAALSIRDQFVHPTMGLKETDPDCDLDYVPVQGQAHKIDVALSNSLGFGGHNATIALKKFSE